jgi:type II restriction enzyme
MNLLDKHAIERKYCWIDKIQTFDGNFNIYSEYLEKELNTEIRQQGITALLEHLRLSGDIPESFAHDSTEEKRYSKYTDILLSESFKFMGFKSLVLKERSDTADVEVFGKSFSFIADAKAFRLSRTAKNQKDFKVQAMDRWKYGKPHAMIVCPIYQLPIRSSQIYQQAAAYNICIFTYSHLAVLVAFSQYAGQVQAEELLFEIFQAIPALNPSKEAVSYWFIINKIMLSFSKIIAEFWEIEKQTTVEAIQIAKQMSLNYLATRRERIMRMSHEDALSELIKIHKIDSRIQNIASVSHNGIWDIS